MAGTTDTVVSLDDVEIHFENRESLVERFRGGTPAVKAVDGVSLDIGENEVIALVGESGCGKTTLGKTAIGLQRPTGGSVRYRGQDIWRTKEGSVTDGVPFADIRRALQIIHQDPGSSLNPNQKVRAILSAPLKKWNPGLDRQARLNRIHTSLSVVGMTPPGDFMERYPHQLSGGEKQRVALIRALLMNPDLILADEAISALDVSLRVDMMDLFLDLQERFGTSFLFISHDLSNARYLAGKADGRIGIMYLGELVEIGPAEQIISNPRHPYTKALRWATPSLRGDDDGDLPMRSIDIPDPIDPPSGCRYHTRCPEAREACVTETPEKTTVESGHRVACFREESNHPYWSSDELTED